MRQVTLISILFIAFCSATLAQSATRQCPKIKIFMFGDPGNTVHFYAEVHNFSGPANFTYDWLISGDLKLISGEKSERLQARRTGEDTGTVTVFITPFPKGCENHANESTPSLERRPTELIDEFGKMTSGSIKVRVDYFFIRLRDHPHSRGLMVIYKDKDSLKRAQNMVAYMGFRKWDMSLVSLVFTSEPGDATRFWLIPEGAKDPEIADAVYVRAQDFVNLEKIFKPAKKVRKKTNKN